MYVYIYIYIYTYTHMTYYTYTCIDTHTHRHALVPPTLAGDRPCVAPATDAPDLLRPLRPKSAGAAAESHALHEADGGPMDLR